MTEKIAILDIAQLLFSSSYYVVIPCRSLKGGLMLFNYTGRSESKKSYVF